MVDPSRFAPYAARPRPRRRGVRERPRSVRRHQPAYSSLAPDQVVAGSRTEGIEGVHRVIHGGDLDQVDVVLVRRTLRLLTVLCRYQEDCGSALTGAGDLLLDTADRPDRPREIHGAGPGHML